MLYLFHGGDDFSMREALGVLREAVGPPEVREANTHELEAAEASSPQRLQALTQSAPFLAERRLVIVRGLLGGGEERGVPRRQGQTQAAATPAVKPGDWETLKAVLSSVPPSTDVVLIEERLRGSSTVVAFLTKIAEVRQFPPLRGEALRRWVRERAPQKGGALSPAAIGLLCDLVGSNLWAMDAELEKLALYCHGRTAEVEDVRRVSATAREASVFEAVDAVLESRTEGALRAMERLLAEGSGVSHLLAMLARQARLVVLTQELLAQGVKEVEVGQRLGIPQEFAVRKTVAQAKRTSPERLRRLYRLLLETDLAIKTGSLAEGVALELLVSRAAAPARQGPATARTSSPSTTKG
ncbi:MAG: DNA polymerase III subunit delta [Chloroflexi bacterium]|nr:DNA polymerase III subunit delta [Chloroflexota bacterium]